MANASGGDATRTHAAGPPQPTADLFIAAGAIVAERAARQRAGRSEVEVILRRAAEQAGRLLAGGVA